MVKQSSVALMVVAVLSSLLGGGALFATSSSNEGSFPDVESDHPNFTAIEALVDEGVIEGYPDGTFRPSHIINRAEATAMIVRALNASPDPGKYLNCFDDVKSQWFAPLVCFGKSEKSQWLKGYPGTQEFRPGLQIIIVEAIRMAIDAFDIPRVAPIELLKHKWDVPLGYTKRPEDFANKLEWYYEYLVTAREYTFLDITPVANKLMTRAEMAEVIFRVWRYHELGPSGLLKQGIDDETDVRVPANDDTGDDENTGSDILDLIGETGQDSVITAGTCNLSISKPTHDAAVFVPGNYCPYTNSARSHDSQIWLGQANLAVVWGAPFDFKYSDPAWAMALAYTSEKFDVNPNYLMSVAIKESHANCSPYPDGCFQIAPVGFQEVKDRFPKYIDTSKTHADLIPPFGASSVVAALYMKFAETLWESMYQWSSFWPSAADPEARTKFLTRGYNRGLWEQEIAKMLGERRAACLSAPDIMDPNAGCFPYGTYDQGTPNGIAYDHANAIMTYCRALSQNTNIYDPELTKEMVEQFIEGTIKPTYSSTQNVDWPAVKQKATSAFTCLQDGNGKISFRYDFKTLLQQILPMLP